MVIDDQGHFCSAVAITKRDILTAAHCITKGRPHRVFFHDAQNAPVLLEPSRIVLHPQYDADAIKNRTRSIDMAIINLNETLPKDIEVASISTQSPDQDSTITVIGYGRQDEKKPQVVGKLFKVDLKVVEPYGKSKILLWLSSAKSGSSIGACHGDSGGPQFFEGELIAITTWTTGPANRECGEFTQGALIKPQIEWIRNSLTKDETLKSN